jgi:hypothetical protein
MPDAIVALDVRGDGKPDLAVVNFDTNNVSVLANNGDGTLAPRVDYPAGTFPTAVAAADLNGDGKPDLAIVSNGTVSVLLDVCHP